MKWGAAPLEVVAPARGSDRRFKPDELVWHLTLDQIEAHTGRVLEKIQRPFAEAGTSTFVFDNRNVLYSKLRPYLNKVVCPAEPGVATTELVPLRPDPRVLDRNFLAYYLRSPRFLAFASSTVAGVKMPRIIMGKLWEHEIPLPPLSEQRRIVEILDQADALRKKRAEADAKAARILPALFCKMFGDPATNPNRWPMKSLCALGATVRYGLGQPPNLKTSGVPFIRATNISRGKIEGQDVLRVDPDSVPKGRDAFLRAGEVIVVRSGAYTGDVAQVTGRWLGSVIGYDLVVSPGTQLLGEFLEAYLLSPFIQKGYFANAKARAGQPHLNAEQLAATPVPEIPLDLQRTFAKCVCTYRGLRDAISQSGQQLSVLCSTLLHRAFTGELTARWREAHMKELLAEMEAQSKLLEAVR
jgi:type I restriction enzyme S subunit